MVELAVASYVIREFRHEDEERVLRLLHLVLGEGRSFARTAEFWRWKHFQNPFGTSHLLLAVNHEVCGLRAFMQWRFVSPTGRLHAVRAVDTSTHPEYRRLGIFSRLTRASLEQVNEKGVHLVFNTPNPQSMAGYLKMGWKLVGRPRLLIRPLNPLRLIPAALLRNPGQAAPGNRRDFFRSSPPPVEALLEHSEHMQRILTFDDGLCADGIRTDRSLEFLRWRYVSPPSPKYYAVWDGARPVAGALVFRPNIRHGLREIMVCEFLAGYGSGGDVRELMARLARMVRADYLVAAAAPGTHHWRMLRRAGFLALPARLGPNFTVFPLNLPATEIDPTRLEHWRISLGDLEIF